jgi:protein ImuB
MFACIYIPEFSVHALRYGPNASDAILDCAEAWSPRVERAGPDAVALDIEGLERLWGSYADIAAALSDKASELGFTANVAVASNPDAAIHAAKGFRGITVIPRGMEAERLRDLPIALLSPPEGIRETLERWGIRTFGVSRRCLRTILQYGWVMWECCCIDRRAAARCDCSSRIKLLRFIESMELVMKSLLEPLSFVLARLLGQICARLKCRGLATPRNSSHTRSVEYILRLPIPTQDSRLLLKLLQLDVESRPPKSQFPASGLSCSREALASRSTACLFLFARAGEARIDAGANRRHRRPGKYRFSRIDGHAPARRISNAAIHRFFGRRLPGRLQESTAG